MIAKHLFSAHRLLFSQAYGFKKIKVTNPVAELDGD